MKTMFAALIVLLLVGCGGGNSNDTQSNAGEHTRIDGQMPQCVGNGCPAN